MQLGLKLRHSETVEAVDVGTVGPPTTFELCCSNFPVSQDWCALRPWHLPSAPRLPRCCRPTSLSSRPVTARPTGRFCPAWKPRCWPAAPGTPRSSSPCPGSPGDRRDARRLPSRIGPATLGRLQAPLPDRHRSPWGVEARNSFWVRGRARKRGLRATARTHECSSRQSYLGREGMPGGRLLGTARLRLPAA